MPSIFTSTKVFNRPIDHQSTSNDRLKPVMTTGLVNMHIDRSIANLVEYPQDLPSRDGPEVIKLEYSLKLKIKRNDWLLADTCPQAANYCTLF